MLLCVDSSAWHRSDHAAVAAAWQDANAAEPIGICDQVRLEILYSARSASHYDALASELMGLIPIAMTPGCYLRALEVQRSLAYVGGLHHRSVTIADLLIAAAAEESGATVWHYAEDFDRIAAVTGQPVRWIVEHGSI